MLSDILKALELWPQWKRLKDAPERIDALEKRLAALTAAVERRPQQDACPSCGGSLSIDRTEADRVFGDLGVRRRFFRCTSCGFEAERELKPGEL